MSNKSTPQDTPEEPKLEVKPTDELADEQLGDVNAGAVDVFAPNPAAQDIHFGPIPEPDRNLNIRKAGG